MDGPPVGGIKKQKHHLVLTVIIIFVGILGLLIYTSFYNPEFKQTITGNIIKNTEKDPNIENSAEFEAILSIPEQFKINSQVNKISLKISQPTILYFGDKKIELDKKSSIIIDDFQGKIEINSNTLNNFNGKATKIFVNGLPITQTSGSVTKIEFQEELGYDYIKLNEFYIDSLSYITSGKLKINKNKITINLDEERIAINDFFGDMKLDKKELELNGFIDQSHVKEFLDSEPVEEEN